MITLQLVGQGAFILASLALGAKLLLLWRRSRELPELSVGLSFLLGGGFGYIAWFTLAVMALRGAGQEALHAVGLIGLACTCGGSVCNGIGVARIYHPGRSTPVLAVAALGAVMVVAWLRFLLAGPGSASMSFWVAILASAPIYGWAGFEAFALAGALHKRARLGLAEGAVVNRAAQWGVASVAVVAMIAISTTSRFVHGQQMPAWVGATNATIGLVAAVAIWLGFFPPRTFLQRLHARYAD